MNCYQTRNHGNDVPRRWPLLKVKFSMRFCPFHTIERTSVRIPASSRQTSTNAQAPINFLDGILLFRSAPTISVWAHFNRSRTYLIDQQ